MSSNGDLPASPAESSTVLGLAREVEQISREVRHLRQVEHRVEELAAALAELAETIVLKGRSQSNGPAPGWLDHPLDAGSDPARSGAAHYARRLLAELARWVETVYLRYSDASGGLPDCWMRHPDVVEELLWLHRAWLTAYDSDASPTAVGDWHDRQRPGVVLRVQAYAGTCSLDAHQSGPAQWAVTPASADEVDVIAGWWATARDQPAPAPTEEQLAASVERHRRARR